jgi:hypothetical protein
MENQPNKGIPQNYNDKQNSAGITYAEDTEKNKEIANQQEEKNSDTDGIKKREDDIENAMDDEERIGNRGL